MFDNAAIDGGEVTLRSGTTDWQCPRNVRFASDGEWTAALRQVTLRAISGHTVV